MLRTFRTAALAALSSIVLSLSVAPSADAAGALQLWRLDCGHIKVADLNDFSDSFAYTGRSMDLVASCYLIRHGDSYMLWDTGLPLSDLGATGDESLTVSLVDQLKVLGLTPSRITDIAISHYHLDHTGQASSFPDARLLLGQADIDVLRQPGAQRTAPLSHWLSEGGKLDPVSGDRDVYGDGTVIMLNLPGHTPGHHGLLVHLPGTGYVLLSGDAAHLRENYDNNGLPSWNTDRADTLASMDRIRAIVAHTGAILVIQHDPRDVTRLPAFPQAAE